MENGWTEQVPSQAVKPVFISKHEQASYHEEFQRGRRPRELDVSLYGSLSEDRHLRELHSLAEYDLLVDSDDK